ncbi:hypothetical protein KL771_12345 [Hyphomicrobiaceae bacterium 22]|uniref:Uncharacterized protein n=1 Tax=Prosthecodimorpha staleyi TaxID=2840188 RepID=A0A947GIT4_9HYPH|nr:hypothetical protein [Prosthecodimorpha staleyi]MBT9290254.1 hypothetical protein [Prosthecodimorpha staleyi]
MPLLGDGDEPGSDIRDDASRRIRRCHVGNIDLAIVDVDLPGAVPAEIGSLRLPLAEPSSVYQYYAFDALPDMHFVKSPVRVQVTREVEILTDRIRSGVVGYEFQAIGGEVLPGHSGGVILNESGNPAAIVAFRWRENGKGLAISLPALRFVWAEFATVTQSRNDDIRSLAKGQAAAVQVKASVAKPSKPQAPKKSKRPLDPDDLNKGRFGGSSTAAGFELTGVLRRVAPSGQYFVHDLIVRSTDGRDLNMPILFVLHETFNPSEFLVRTAEPTGDRAVLAEIISYGVYTAGAVLREIDGDDVLLEYDVSRLPGLPPDFLSR